MALRTLAARVRVQTPALRLSPPASGRPSFHSAAATRRRPPASHFSPPAGGRPCLISIRNLGGSATLEHLEKSYELFKVRVGLLEKFGKILKWSLASIIPVPLVYTIAQHY